MHTTFSSFSHSPSPTSSSLSTKSCKDGSSSSNQHSSTNEEPHIDECIVSSNPIPLEETSSPETSETPHYQSSILPYVCWYQNDFLGGVRGMRAHEIGIYTILLNEMYARGHPLDLSTERLARLCGCDKRTLTSTLNMLIEEGKIIHLANGLWNKRCDSVFHERTKLLEKKSFAGRSSAQKRKKINAKIQHLLNKHTTNDTRNSEAQKIEEKETPYGVSQKKQLCPERNTFSFSSQDRPTTEDLLPNDPIFPHSRIVSTASPQFSQQQSSSLYTKGTRLPSDWIADISMAISEGLSEEQARWQEKKFRDYWKAKGGKDAVKIDWSATWRNWCRREIERLREHREKPYPVSSQLHKTHLNFREENLYQNLINYHHENYDPLS